MEMDIIASPVWFVYVALSLTYFVLAAMPRRSRFSTLRTKKQLFWTRFFILSQAVWGLLFGLNNSEAAWMDGHGPALWSVLSDATLFIGYLALATLFRAYAGRKADRITYVMMSGGIIFGVIIPAFLAPSLERLHIPSVGVLCVTIEAIRWMYAFKLRQANFAATVLLYASILFGAIGLLRSVVLYVNPELMAYNQPFLNLFLPMVSLTFVVFTLVSNSLKAQDDLMNLALRDGLTGLLNRRAFMDQYIRAVHSRAMINEPKALLVVDLDHFKSINDSFGHKVGDDILIQAARRIEAVARNEDIVGRYGGEEFILLINNCTPEVIIQIFERLRQTLSDIEHPDLSVEGRVISASMGAVCFRGVRPFQELFEAADNNLYQAKGQGRDQLVQTSHDSVEALFVMTTPQPDGHPY